MDILDFAVGERERNGNDMERYRSGHNEAVLKTVCPKGRMGSNPILSAGDILSAGNFISNKFSLEKYPRG